MYRKVFVLFSIFLFLVSHETNAFKIIRICNDDITDNNDISWTTNIDTCDQFLSFQIFGRPSVDSSFRLIDSVLEFENNYNHDADNSPEKWSYYILAIFDCDQVDTVISDTVLVDIESPPLFTLDSVSVADGNVVIGWQPNSAPDASGYRLQIGPTGQSVFLASVEGRLNTLFTDSFEGNPMVRSETYRIATLDSCGNSSPLSTVVHSTIHLTALIDSCSSKITLEWSDYQGWNVSNYRVLMSVDGGFSYSMVEELNGGAENRYVIKNLSEESNYCFKVRAISSEDINVTSSSNRICLTEGLVKNPEYVYIKEVTVEGDNVRVNWIIDQESDLSGFIIQRGESLNALSNFDIVSYNGGTSFTYIDSSVDVNDDVFFYKVIAESICDSLVATSNASPNIRLSIEKEDDFYRLNWSSYFNWDKSIDRYRLFRSNGDTLTSEFTLIADLDPGQTRFLDYFEDINILDSGVCYFILAEEDGPNDFGVDGESRSNISCVFNDPIAFVPNAFAPFGENNIFKPEGILLDYSQSSMEIYSRWGQKVFESNDVKTGWNGRLDNGEIAPGDVYIYVVKLRGLNGTPLTLSGSVTLLR